VQVVRVDLATRKIDFHFLENLSPAPTRREGKTERTRRAKAKR
jgi:ribonuclease R